MNTPVIVEQDVFNHHGREGFWTGIVLSRVSSEMPMTGIDVSEVR